MCVTKAIIVISLIILTMIPCVSSESDKIYSVPVGEGAVNTNITFISIYNLDQKGDTFYKKDSGDEAISFKFGVNADPNQLMAWMAKKDLLKGSNYYHAASYESYEVPNICWISYTFVKEHTSSYLNTYGDEVKVYTPIGLMLGTIKTGGKNVTFSMLVTDLDDVGAIFESIRIEVPESIEKQQLQLKLRLKENEIKDHANKVRANDSAIWLDWLEHTKVKVSTNSSEKKMVTIRLGATNSTNGWSMEIPSGHNITDQSDPLYWLNKADLEIENNISKSNPYNIFSKGTLLNDTLKDLSKAIDLDTRGEIFEKNTPVPMAGRYFMEYVPFIFSELIVTGNASKIDNLREILKWMLYDAKIYDKLSETESPDGSGDGNILSQKAIALEYIGDYKAASECYMNASKAYDCEGIISKSTNYYGGKAYQIGIWGYSMGPWGEAVKNLEDAQRTLAKAQELESSKKKDVTTAGDI